MNKAVAGFAVVGFAIAVFRLLQAGPSNEALELSAGTNESSRCPDVTSSNRETRSCAPVTSANKSAKTDSADRLQMTQERRQQVRELIRQSRPQQDETVVEVWVEEFGDMSNEEILFLIRQSGLSRGATNSGTQSFVGTTELTSKRKIELSHSDKFGFENHRVDGVRRNLQNAMTIGYRDRLDLNVLSASQSADSHQFSVWRMTVGKVIETWDPLHVALRTPGPVFFQLVDGRLTRNGMFARMQHGQLGLRDGGTLVALRDAPLVPADCSCEIMSDGRVVGTDVGRQIGTIRVVNVKRADRLTTNDGVYFHTDAKVQLAEHFELQSGALELSNVDVGRNRDLLLISSGFFHGSPVLIPEVGSVD